MAIMRNWDSEVQASRKRSPSFFLGFLILFGIYAGLVVVSLIYYHEPFNPLTMTLAELGNPVANPSGAWAYDAGILVTGLPVALIVILSLTIWRQKYVKSFQKGRIYFYVTATLFLLFSVFNMITAVIPLGTNNELNGLLSLLTLLLFQLFAVVSAISIRGNVDHTRWIPAMGFATALINTVLGGLMIIAGVAVAYYFMTVLIWVYIVAFMYEIA